MAIGFGQCRAMSGSLPCRPNTRAHQQGGVAPRCTTQPAPASLHALPELRQAQHGQSFIAASPRRRRDSPWQRPPRSIAGEAPATTWSMLQCSVAASTRRAPATAPFSQHGRRSAGHNTVAGASMQLRRIDSSHPRSRAAGEEPATTRRPQHALRFNAAPPPCSSRPRSSVVGEVPATTRSVLQCSVAALTRRTATPRCAASQHHQRRRTLQWKHRWPAASRPVQLETPASECIAAPRIRLRMLRPSTEASLQRRGCCIASIVAGRAWPITLMAESSRDQREVRG